MNSNPTWIPSTPLKIITVTLLALFVIVPVVVLITHGELGSIPLYVAGGFTLVAFMLAVMFLQRLFLWVYVQFYWYIMAALFFPLLICVITALIPVLTTDQITMVNQLPVWGKSLFVPGALVGIAAIVLVFRRGKRSPAPVEVPQSPSPKPTTILDTAQQLADRKKSLTNSETKAPKK